MLKSVTNNKFISNDAAVPVIDAPIFEGHENERFAVSQLDPQKVNNYQDASLEQAYLRLRGRVYIDQTGTLPESAKRFDGTEVDRDDERSRHFVVVENKLGRASVFACMRLICKRDEEDLLPIELEFPESFPEPASVDSIEVSRFIARNEERRQNYIAEHQLFAAGMNNIVDSDGEALAIVEPILAKSLKRIGVPLNQISEAKLLPQYGDENVAIEIDKPAFRERLGSEALNRFFVKEGEFSYWT